MNKFTPGPWIMGGCSGRMIQPESKSGLDYWIADVDTKANAQLIAAAPTMLDALEKADELIDLLIIDNADAYVEERAKIRAAIRAAKGESV